VRMPCPYLIISMGSLCARVSETSTNVDGYNSFHLKRTLYIGDFLYTLSDVKVKMNDLENLVDINEIQFSPRVYESSQRRNVKTKAPLIACRKCLQS
jgi:hypothetical protein